MILSDGAVISLRDGPLEKIVLHEEQRSVDVVNFFIKLRKSTWPLIPEGPQYSCPGKGSCPIAKRWKDVKPKYSDELISESKSCFTSFSEIGDSLNVISLLSSTEDKLNYLVRKSGERVQVEEKAIGGKYIMLCCFHVPVFLEGSNAIYVQALVDVCSDLYSTRNDFEMVVVVKMRDFANFELVFNHFLSGFPSSCLVVPFQDSKRRDFICKYFDNGAGCFACPIVDPQGNILYRGPDNFAVYYGAEGFPFTEDHLQNMCKKDHPTWRTPATSTVEGLLRCKPSDVLERINPDGAREEVSISKLKDTLVGLYLCAQGNLIPTLHEVYQACRAQKLEFEVVVVYLPFNDAVVPHVYQMKIDSLLKEEGASWWRLPFNNCVSRRLKRLSSVGFFDMLTIVGPQGEFVDAYGAEVLSHFGIGAYPFTRECVVQRELTKLRTVSLETLLVYGSRDYVLGANGRIDVRELLGRNVLVYLDCLDDDMLYSKLETWYDKIKAKDADFEVVLVRRFNEETNAFEDGWIASMVPWLVCPFDPDHSAFVERSLFADGGACNALIQFGKDGRLCSIQADYHLEVCGPDAFPFGDNLRVDVINQFREMPIINEFFDNME